MKSSVKRRVVGALAVSIVFLAIGLFVVLRQLLMPELERLESHRFKQNTQSILHFIQHKSSDLYANVKDWATWTAMYEFAEGNNDAFVIKELSLSTLNVLEIDLMVIFDDEGNVLWQLAQDSRGDVIEDIEGIETFLQDNHKRMGFQNMMSLPFMYGFHPISDSSGLKVSNGTLLFGVEIDQDFQDRINDVSQSNFEFYPVTKDNPALNSDGRINGYQYRLTSDEKKNVLLELVITNEAKEPVSVLALRDKYLVLEVFQSGLAMVYFALFICGVLSIGVSYLILSRQVVSPIVLLTRKMEQMSQSNELNIIEFPEREDEIGQLYCKFNNMIESVNIYQKNLEEVSEYHELASYTDPLTQVNNRRYLDVYMSRVSEKILHKDLDKVLMIMLDLDYFKTVNDKHGHDAGDEILKSFAQLLALDCREKDMVFRLGGEEFLIVASNINAEEAKSMVSRLLARIENHCFCLSSGQRLKVTASIGLCWYPYNDSCHPWSDSLTQADKALYEAKEAGRNQWRGYFPSDVKGQQHLVLKSSAG
ncbi:diguanylate cyclase [Vibrio sp. Of7-15]|uniref:diguanylate cyclase n=1 Tax=Vibrio sp. Of7-15 TaxID=2724879 RepID=UPI001EF2E2E8|nr:diguanylate cyclase [Vibrio sp. Of7-15]MCG7495580.1 diguanylate cyclase [Vibrio sp. Of7-15]